MTKDHATFEMAADELITLGGNMFAYIIMPESTLKLMNPSSGVDSRASTTIGLPRFQLRHPNGTYEMSPDFTSVADVQTYLKPLTNEMVHLVKRNSRMELHPILLKGFTALTEVFGCWDLQCNRSTWNNNVSTVSLKLHQQ